MNNKTCIIVRGVSTSGKTTLAETMKDLMGASAETIICTADDYHYDENGRYNFKVENLSAAHTWCFKKFCRAIKECVPMVIQNNTNTKQRDFQPYIDFAESHGYRVFSVVLEKRHEGKNSHFDNVPNAETILARQERETKESLKLR